MSSSMSVVRVALLSAAVVGALAGRAVAQNADTDYRRYCAGDYQRLCAAYSPGTPEVEQCFRDNFNQLSKGCRDTIVKYNPGFRRR